MSSRPSMAMRTSASSPGWHPGAPCSSSADRCHVNDRARETRTARAVVHGASVASLSIVSAHAGTSLDRAGRPRHRRPPAAIRDSTSRRARRLTSLQGPQAEPFVETRRRTRALHTPPAPRGHIPGVADVMLQRLASDALEPRTGVGEAAGDDEVRTRRDPRSRSHTRRAARRGSCAARACRGGCSHRAGCWERVQRLPGRRARRANVDAFRRHPDDLSPVVSYADDVICLRAARVA